MHGDGHRLQYLITHGRVLLEGVVISFTLKDVVSLKGPSLFCVSRFSLLNRFTTKDKRGAEATQAPHMCIRPPWPPAKGLLRWPVSTKDGAAALRPPLLVQVFERWI